MADDSGKIVAHSDPTMVWTDILELFGTGRFKVTEDGNWVTTESIRVWVASFNEGVFGSGWHHDE